MGDKEKEWDGVLVKDLNIFEEVDGCKDGLM